MTEIAFFALSSLIGLGIYKKIRIPEHMPKSRKMFLSYQKGLVLGQEISKLLGPTPTPLSIPEYKWFSNLVEILLVLQKRSGMSIRSCLKHLRSILIEDVKLERKRFGEILSSLSQFLIISFMTIFFYVSFIILIENILLETLLVVVFVQLVGGSLFFFLEKRVYKKYFNTIDKILCSMLKFSVLSNANLPNQKILSLSLDEIPHEAIQKEEGLFRDNFSLFRDNFLEAVNKWKNEGNEIESELQFQISELYDHRDYQKEKFLRFIAALRFSILGVFFLSSYLFLILSLSGSLLI